MFTVDCQTHLFPRDYAEILCRNKGWVHAEKNDFGYTIRYGDIQSFNLKLEAYDLEKKLEDMDADGIDVSILSVNMPGPEVLDENLSLEGARICNDYVAGLVARNPKRFAGIATVPLGHPVYMMEEYTRAIHKLGLRGIMLFSHIKGQPVDSAIMESLYMQAEKDEIPLVIHPTVPVWGEVLREYQMIPMFGLMVDTSIAMLRLILGGVLERRPKLLIVHPHCGGVLPYLMPRVEEQTEVKKRGRENIKRPPGEYYRNVYLDMTSPSVLAMEYAYRSSRPDRLLFGSDHPWVKIKVLKQCILSLDIPDADKALILGENARKLFRLDI
jgi:predicted TIM-barrel fold metal-dependent hydrolase